MNAINMSTYFTLANMPVNQSTPTTPITENGFDSSNASGLGNTSSLNGNTIGIG